MPQINITATGLKESVNFLYNFANNVEPIAETILDDLSIRMQSYMKENLARWLYPKRKNSENLRDNVLREKTSKLGRSVVAKTSYAQAVEKGTKPHKIVAKNSPLLVFQGKDGKTVKVPSVNHPGASGYPSQFFGQKSFKRLEPEIDVIIVNAINKYNTKSKTS